MKLLVVMSHAPFPPRTGSGVVAYNSMKYLSRNHSLSFICTRGDGDQSGQPEFVERAEFVPRRVRAPFARKWGNRLNVLAGIPASFSDVRSREMRNRVRDTLEAGEFDAVLLFEMNAIQHCPRSWYSRIVVNIEDPPSIRLRRFMELPIWSSALQKLRFSLIMVITRRYEQRYLPGMGKVILLSQSDMEDMQKERGFGNLGVVPYGIERVPAESIPEFTERARGTIIFSGNMFHPPNVDGALHFLRNVFPAVLRDYAAAVFWIVGADPDVRLQREAARFGDRVVVTGRVISVSEHLQRAVVSVCPVRLQIGCQTKILEALACGTPVVTTSAGNSGIRGRSGKELWVEDDPQTFAARIVGLLRGENWRAFSEEGRQFVERTFSWERSAGSLEQHIAAVRSSFAGRK